MFLWTEKKFLKSLVDDEIDVNRWLSEFVVQFLTKNQVLRKVTDKVND